MTAALKGVSRGVITVMIALACATHAVPARAQEPPASTSAETNLQEIAKAQKNPLTQSANVQFQFATGFGVGPEHRAGESLNLQPVLPFPLTSAWSVIARPSVSVTHTPPPDEQFGLQDLQLPLYLTPTEGDKWIWGVGPIVQFPSATPSGLGTGKWSAGPSGALLYSNGPWLNGVLVSHLWSFAGDRDRAAVNQTSIEVLASYNFESGWFLQFHPVNTYDWTADSGNAWTVPVGLDVGRVFVLGERAISVQLGAYRTVVRPEGAAGWVVRAQLQFSFAPRDWFKP
jgi:hypothetical protein